MTEHERPGGRVSEDDKVHGARSLAVSSLCLLVLAVSGSLASAASAPAPGRPAKPAWLGQSNRAYAMFGSSVASAGDVNGDGYEDVVVGAPTYGDQTNDGRAFLFAGSILGLRTRAAWVAMPDQSSSQFGSSVASAGDVNADGYADVIVGAPFSSGGQSHEGKAFVYLGSAAGLGLAPDWTAEPDQEGAQFGSSVASAGDVNGDGYADVIVGAPAGGDFLEGRAFLYMGSANGLSQSAAWTSESDQANAEFGFSVASAGDVNSDGYDDVIVGTPYYSSSLSKVGRADLFLGSASGPSVVASWSAVGDQGFAYLGSSVASAGDVNGDGYDDVLLGTPAFSGVWPEEGRADAYLGSADGPGVAPDWTALGNQGYADFGSSVASAGDVNADGYDDVIVGARVYNGGQTNEGRAFIFQGSVSGLSTLAAWTGDSGQGNAQLGSSVASAGDVNQDGFADWIVGAPLYSRGQYEEGVALAWQGR